MVIVIRIRREKIITQPGKSKVPPYCECYLQIWFPHFKKWYSRTGKVQRRAMRMTESTEDFPNKEHLKNTLLSGKDEIWEAHDTSPQNHLWTEETSTDGLLLCHTQCKNQRASNEPDRNQMQNRQKGVVLHAAENKSVGVLARDIAQLAGIHREIGQSILCREANWRLPYKLHVQVWDKDSCSLRNQQGVYPTCLLCFYSFIARYLWAGLKRGY